MLLWTGGGAISQDKARATWEVSDVCRMERWGLGVAEASGGPLVADDGSKDRGSVVVRMINVAVRISVVITAFSNLF